VELKRELAEVRRELHERTSERDEGLAAEVLVCGSAQRSTVICTYRWSIIAQGMVDQSLQSKRADVRRFRQHDEVRRKSCTDTVIPVPFANVITWPEKLPPIVPSVIYRLSKAPSRSFQFAE
jgi:hypothetical protein